jgi:integrase
VITTMPRPRPPHLHREVTRHGKAVWYVRVGRGKRIRIKPEFGTPDFDAEYAAAIAGQPKAPKGPSSSTLAWLFERYRETPAWRDLSLATRQQREAIITQVIKTAGTQPFAKITRATIVTGRDRRASVPAQARHFLETMRGLFKWAAKASLMKEDPTIGVEDPARPKGGGFPVWTEEQVSAYERRWPIGTRQRVWLNVLLYTGLRRGDAVRLGRQHVRNGVATIKTEKSGFELEVTLPILPVLAETLKVGPCGELAFIAGATGKPFDKRSFGNQFRKACRAAGVKRSAHGLRKIAATRAANAGATVAQLEAIFGWTGGRMASLYTRAADRRRLAMEGMHLLANDARTSIPAPEGEVRASEGIDE